MIASFKQTYIDAPKRGINIIAIAADAPEDVINALSGKVGRLNGVNAKTAYSAVCDGRD